MEIVGDKQGFEVDVIQSALLSNSLGKLLAGVQKVKY
jgi:hypothetical protein